MQVVKFVMKKSIFKYKFMVRFAFREGRKQAVLDHIFKFNKPPLISFNYFVG